MAKSNKLLYHYTTAKGLTGIIANKAVWATNILYLNDSKEFHYAGDVFENYIINKIKEIGNNADIYSFYNLLLGHVSFHFKFIEQGIYVFSLSRKADSLSQWRAYSSGTNGFCIGFDLKKLQELSRRSAGKLVKCNYSQRALEGSIKKYVEKTIDIYKKAKASSNPDTDEVLAAATTELQKIAAAFKHSAFKEEEENRLVISYKPSEHKISFREGKSMLIPFLKIIIPDEIAKTLVKEILIGPTPHSELSKKSVDLLLDKNGFNKCTVKITKAPFRSW